MLNFSLSPTQKASWKEFYKLTGQSNLEMSEWKLFFSLLHNLKTNQVILLL